jgi:hypothetical protein
MAWGRELPRDEADDAPSWPLEFDKPIAISVQSAGVEWRGATYHLVHLGQARFSLDRDAGRLMATIHAGLTTFDRVDYEVSGAVYGAAGRLLGVARVGCPVERVWLGKPLHMGKDLTLDFGTSLDFESARRFTVAVSRRAVLTPDQWQKG